MTKTDQSLKAAILSELEYEPGVAAEHIGVTTHNGIATLYGHVKSFTERMAAEDAVQTVRGVRGLANEIEVVLPGDPVVEDDELALRAARTLDWDPQVGNDGIKLRVQQGKIDLDGDVSTLFEKAHAERKIAQLDGVVGVYNHLNVKPVTPESNLRERITAALGRQASREAETIRVSVSGRDVTLSGEVGTFAERRAIEAVAARAPGVNQIRNDIQVGD